MSDNRNIKGQGITRSLCGMSHRLKIGLNIPLKLMRITKHFLSRLRTQSDGQKLCVGLKLPLPEAEMFLGKTDFKLNSMKGEGYVYQCV